MQTDGTLHMFTTLFGWHYYGVLWAILEDTGLILLPFLGLFIDHVRRVLSEGGFLFGRDDDGALAPLTIDFLTMVFVLWIAGVPQASTTLTASTFTHTVYESALNPARLEETISSDTNNYRESAVSDRFDPQSETIEVPYWWFGVMQISQGIKYALVNDIDVHGDVYRQIRSITNRVSIANPVLRDRVNDFHAECYGPALARYRRDRDPASFLGTPDPDSEVTGVDLTWLGAKEFTKPGGLYSTMLVSGPRDGFPFNPERDTAYTNSAAAGGAGAPLCSEYWTKIRDEIVAEAKDTGYWEALVNANGLWGTIKAFVGAEPPADDVARIFLERTPMSMSFSLDKMIATREYGSNWFQDKLRTAASTLSVVELAPLAIKLEFGLEALIQGLVIVQAFLLLVAYLALPIGLLVSRFSLRFLMTGSILIFSISFFSVLWAFASWLDNVLALALWSDQTIMGTLFAGGPDELSKRLVQTIAVALLYIFSTAAYAWILVAAGSNVGVAISAAGAVSGSAISAGNTGSAVGAASLRNTRRMNRAVQSARKEREGG